MTNKLSVFSRNLSVSWPLISLLAITCCLSFAVRADEADLQTQIAALKVENELLRTELARCAGQDSAHIATDPTTIGLLRKLATQQSDNAELAMGLGGGPLIIPEALLRSVVPNEYIVLLDPDAPRPANPADVAALYGVPQTQVKHVYARALAGFAIRATLAQRDTLEARAGVAGIAQNGRVFSTGTLTNTPNLKAPRSALKPVASHQNQIDVYLFDTGIRAAHSDLQGRVAEVGFSFFDNGIAGEDCAGHGTHVAARIAGNNLGISQSARLASVKVIDRFGTGDVATVVAGIDWVMAQSGDLKLINMSLTRRVTEDPNPLDLAVNALIDTGAIVVVAAGNSASDALDFTPARVSRAITVGSSIGPALSNFSNAGIGVDIYAPGEAVTSASIRDICAVQEMSGTSMAAPFVTGLIADMLSSGTDADKIVQTLRSQASRVPTGAFAGETERFTLAPVNFTSDLMCAR